MKLCRDLAAALTTELNAQDWSVVSVAKTALHFFLNASDVRSLSLTVLPERQKAKPVGTSTYEELELTVSVAVVAPSTPDEANKYIDLLEEIAEHLRTIQVLRVDGYAYAYTGCESSYVREHLNKHRVFVGGLLLTYGGGRR